METVCDYDEKVIELVKQYRYLYGKSAKNYKNNDLKTKKWK